MDMVVLDLEWNGAYSRRLKGFINEIIEFGAVKCGPDLEETSCFSSFVKPQVSKRISATISNLTSITNENLTGGAAFMQVVSRFRRWASEAVIFTWSTSDILTLVENCRYFSNEERVPFLSYYCDLQSYVQHRLGLEGKDQVGLAAVAEMLGLNLSGVEHHRALDDSRVTLEILKKVYDPKAMEPFIKKCDEEFYRKITFRTTYICDLENPLIKGKDLLFACPKCGGETERKSKWVLKNRSFRSEFHCKSCGYAFGGRLTIKQKYEGLSVNQKIFPIPIIEAPRALSPGPLGQMQLEEKNGVGILRFPALSRLKTVNHAFTTRAGGVSKLEFASMNLGFGRGDSKEKVSKNYRIFCEAAGFDPDSLVTGAQDHHTNIRRVTAAHRGLGIWREKDLESVDGLCTNDPGVTLVIYCADCVPLYFVDEEHRAIGLAHAGWRGTAAGMAKAMVERMQEEFGSRPEKLVAAIGPSICRECFEVDEPVAQEFLRLPGWEHFVFGPQKEKYQVDLWECNRRFLVSAGVLPEHIALGEVCSMCESDLIFSHRKTRGRRGSNCAFLSLAPENAL